MAEQKDGAKGVLIFFREEADYMSLTNGLRKIVLAIMTASFNSLFMKAIMKVNDKSVLNHSQS